MFDRYEVCARTYNPLEISRDNSLFAISPSFLVSMIIIRDRETMMIYAQCVWNRREEGRMIFVVLKLKYHAHRVIKPVRVFWGNVEMARPTLISLSPSLPPYPL